MRVLYHVIRFDNKFQAIRYKLNSHIVHDTENKIKITMYRTVQMHSRNEYTDGLNPLTSFRILRCATIVGATQWRSWLRPEGHGFDYRWGHWNFFIDLILPDQLIPLSEISKAKVKSSPNARCGPEGSRRFRLPDFRDIRHTKVVRSSASRTGRLYPQECSWYSFSLAVESTPGPMVRSEGNMSLKNPVTALGIDPGTVRLVAQRLNHYANPDPHQK